MITCDLCKKPTGGLIPINDKWKMKEVEHICQNCKNILEKFQHKLFVIQTKQFNLAIKKQIKSMIQ